MSSVLKVDAIQNTAGTSALTIDSSGFTLPKAVAFQMHPSANQSMADASETAFAFGTTTIDPASIVDLSNNRVVITAATAGLWWLSFTCRLKNSAPPRQVVYIKVGGSTKLMFEENSGASAGTTGSQSVTASGLWNLSSGDALTYAVYHSHGSARDIEYDLSSSRAEGFRIGSI
jgi:hypothetical protein